jgi:hypothetical protein
MNPAFARLLKNRKKRERDPNAPPAPTLLGQVKELRLTKEEQDRQGLELVIMRQRLEYMEAKNRRLEIQLKDLENYIRSRIK